MDCLPVEIVERVLGYLSVLEELFVAARVCKLWYELCNDILIKKKACFERGVAEGKVSWRTLVQHGTVPQPRFLHRGVIIGKWMYIFGGSPRKSFCLNDFYKLNIETQHWTKIVSEGAPPTPRIHFTINVHNNEIIIIGGIFNPPHIVMSRPKVCSDVITYDVTTNVWRAPKSLPCAIHGHSATVLRDQIIVFGGASINVMSMTFNLFGIATSDICGGSDKKEIITKEFMSEVEVGPRLLHLEAKLSDTQILIMGGVTKVHDGTQVEHLNDCWLMSVYRSQVQWSQICLIGGPEDVYIRPKIDCFSGVVVGDSVLFITSPMFVTDKILGDGSRIQQFHDRPTFVHQFARVEYFHTFILDISTVCRGEAHWKTVEPNPARRAPKTSLYHSLIVTGDSLLIFGGMNPKSKPTKSPEYNTLHRICVPQEY